MSKEMIYIMADAANQNQLIELRSQLKLRFEGVISSVNRMINRLDKDQPLGLGEEFQNTWEIYRLMGELSEAEMTRKMFDSINSMEE